MGSTFGGGGVDVTALSGAADDINPNLYSTPYSTEPPLPPGMDVNPNLYSDPNATIPSATPGSGVPDSTGGFANTWLGQGLTGVGNAAQSLGKGAGAAGKAAGDVNKSQAQKVQIDQTKAPLGQAGQGARNLATLIQLLQQRDMSYFPAGGSSGRPINQSPTTGGLLGF
jgi:hypothetical protein